MFPQEHIEFTLAKVIGQMISAFCFKPLLPILDKRQQHGKNKQRQPCQPTQRPI